MRRYWYLRAINDHFNILFCFPVGHHWHRIITKSKEQHTQVAASENRPTVSFHPATSCIGRTKSAWKFIYLSNNCRVALGNIHNLETISKIQSHAINIFDGNSSDGSFSLLFRTKRLTLETISHAINISDGKLSVAKKILMMNSQISAKICLHICCWEFLSYWMFQKRTVTKKFFNGIQSPSSSTSNRGNFLPDLLTALMPPYLRALQGTRQERALLIERVSITIKTFINECNVKEMISFYV